MPYIKEEARYRAKSFPIDAGELNFAFTKLINEYLGQKMLSYSRMNDVLGALEGAKLEFYRRVVVPYENEKLSSNGDVY